jgi:DNA-binding GntR family transcriptional regulator
MKGISKIVPIEQHDTLGNRVYFQLREMLVLGEFAPGEVVTLRTLATAIGTSPMPVRDALRQLMIEQAIELLPNRTFRVPLMDRGRFTELCDIRIEVEGVAVERAVRSITDEEIRLAAQVSASFNKECEAKKPNPSKLIALNKNLHFSVYSAARMPILLQLIEGLWTQMGPVFNLDTRPGNERIANRVPCEHHEHLLEALRARDAAAARKALAADINSVAEYIFAGNVLIS